jgi:hypothetical protein
MDRQYSGAKQTNPASTWGFGGEAGFACELHYPNIEDILICLRKSV